MDESPQPAAHTFHRPTALTHTACSIALQSVRFRNQDIALYFHSTADSFCLLFVLSLQSAARAFVSLTSMNNFNILHQRSASFSIIQHPLASFRILYCPTSAIDILCHLYYQYPSNKQCISLSKHSAVFCSLL